MNAAVPTLPPETRRIEVNGTTLNVLIQGEGPEVLLVHGFPDCHTVWRHQAPALVAARRINRQPFYG